MPLGPHNKCVSVMKHTGKKNGSHAKRFATIILGGAGLTCIYTNDSFSENAGLACAAIKRCVVHTVSYMAKPAVTLPPGELMYKWIGFDVSSASRKRSCATMRAASVSRIYNHGLSGEG